MGPFSATTTVLELCINRFSPVELMFVMVLLNITHVNVPPGIICCVRAAVLCSAALFTQKLYIETEFARITQTFEKIEHFSDHHVLGRMAIKRFQTVTCGDFRIPFYPRYFSENAQTGPCRTIPFQRSLIAPHTVASVIFAQ